MYGQFQNPYSYPNMQNRLNTMEPQYRQQTFLTGRIVTGIEEARASQIALDGTPSYFPSPAENKIYVKSLDMNGLPVFLTYRLEMQNQVMQENNMDVETRLTNIENRLKEIEHATNANTSNA